MKNLDRSMVTMDEARVDLVNATREGNVEEQAKAFENFTNALQEDIISRARSERELADSAHNDEMVMVARGTAKAFTNEEMKFFNAVVERQGFEGVEELFPVTIIEDIIGKIRQNHPILSLIDVKSTSALVRWVFPKPNATQAYWGHLCEDIRQMFLGGFQSVEIMASRLSGFVAICKAMLELGPRWLGTYIYESIYEIMETELEKAVINGTGANQPIGMMRSTVNGTVAGGVTTYAEKEAFAVTTLDVEGLGGVFASLAQAKMAGGDVVMIVNPVTYYGKVYGNTVRIDNNGNQVFPIQPVLSTGHRVVLSNAVPEDRAIIGNPKNYFLGVAGQMRINEYEQTLAIEDMQLYIAKMYAMGMAKDPNAFFVLDLAGVSGTTGPALEQPAEEAPTEPVTP